METFYIINQIPKINRAHWNLPWMSCILKFRSLKISLETLERSFHRGEKIEISREASWDIWNSPLYESKTLPVWTLRARALSLSRDSVATNDQWRNRTWIIFVAELRGRKNFGLFGAITGCFVMHLKFQFGETAIFVICIARFVKLKFPGNSSWTGNRPFHG